MAYICRDYGHKSNSAMGGINLKKIFLSLLLSITCLPIFSEKQRNFDNLTWNPTTGFFFGNNIFMGMDESTNTIGELHLYENFSEFKTLAGDNIVIIEENLAPNSVVTTEKKIREMLELNGCSVARLWIYSVKGAWDFEEEEDLVYYIKDGKMFRVDFDLIYSYSINYDYLDSLDWSEALEALESLGE